MTTVMTIISFLRSKALQLVLAVGLTFMVILKARAVVRADAQEDTLRELEKRDEARAQRIRARVDDVPQRLHVEPSDTRGYRD